MILLGAVFLVLFFTWNPISSGDIVQTSLTVDNVAQYFTSQEKCKIMANCKKFEFIKLEEESKEIVKYQVKKSVSENNFDVMSYEDVIFHLKTDIEFRYTFFDMLQLGLEKESDPDKLGPKQAYFFEVCPSFSQLYGTCFSSRFKHLVAFSFPSFAHHIHNLLSREQVYHFVETFLVFNANQVN